MNQNENWEREIEKIKISIERLIFYKISSKEDAEDVLQNVLLSSFKNYSSQKNNTQFKNWVLGIARNKINDYYREKSKQNNNEILTDCTDKIKSKNYYNSIKQTVYYTLEKLDYNDAEILYRYYFIGESIAEIAAFYGIPQGTAKSRMFYAKKNFRDKYPDNNHKIKDSGFTSYKKYKKDDDKLAINYKLPPKIPDYKIIRETNKEPFSVKWEEVLGWFITPKLGEKISWAMYDFPKKERTEYVEMEVTGKAEVHDIEGVEIISTEYDPAEHNKTENNPVIRNFVMQLTDDYSRILLESHTEFGIKKIYTFLDGDKFLNNWGLSEDNIGKEVNIKCKNIIKRPHENNTDNKIYIQKEYMNGKTVNIFDIVGSYNVEIANKSYETICIMDIELYNSGVAAEQFIDRNGKTILWRRFNRDDWAISKYKVRWSEKFPENEKLYINDELYIHWYDCITDYII